MFIVLLKFTDNKSMAALHMPGHNIWLKQGFDDGVFLLAGGLQPGLGGAVMAHNISLIDLQRRVEEDPFVAEHIVKVEIIEIVPGKTDERLAFLLA